MNTTKRILTLALVLTMVFCFTACGKSGDTGTTTAPDSPNTSATGKTEAPSGKKDDAGTTTDPAEIVSARDTLTAAVTQDFGTLDFIHESSAADFSCLCRHYAESLYDIYDYEGNIRWLLGTSYEMVSPTEWIYHLREGVKFTNGNDFNADDFMFTLDLACNTAGYYSYFPYLDWEACEKIDDYTVKVVYKTYAFAYFNNMSLLRMLDAESYDGAEYAMHPVGTGPYVVTDYVVNSHLYMEANPDYWGEPAKIKYLHFKVMNEDTQRINALEAGEVDVANVPLGDLEYVATLSDYNLVTMASRRANALWFNITSDSDFFDSDARLAMSYAINKDAIINIVFNGYAQRCVSPSSLSASDQTDALRGMHDTYNCNQDLEKAKALAEKSGIVGKSYRLVTNGSSNAVGMAEIIQQNAKEIGVTLEIINYDEATFNSITLDTSAYDLYIRELSNPTNTLAHCYTGWLPNVAHLKDLAWLGLNEEETAKYQDYLVKILSETDQATREEMLVFMTEKFVNSPAWFSICEAQKVMAVNKDLGGVYYCPFTNMYYNDWYWTK